jgi:hypothetical protein
MISPMSWFTSSNSMSFATMPRIACRGLWVGPHDGRLGAGVFQDVLGYRGFDRCSVAFHTPCRVKLSS